MLTIQAIDDYILRLDLAEPSEKLKEKIDALFPVVKGRYERGEIDQRTFVELRSRLWSLRERMSEALLPASQRERSGKIF